MSFYDLTKEGVLRPEELFKYRLKRECSLPSKGGQKEFEPDGSWLQGKHLETFLQERTSILSEPRVEKLKNVVEGLWDNKKNLVNLKKAGKFWMHMGFTDERRNWLYPEEALFLMETNTLEVYFQDRPLSIQEAYSKFLGHGMCLEEYQVFCHLRRLGYVVLRHEEERLFTDYERQINLVEYIDKKKRKEKLKKGKGKSSKNITSHSSLPVIKADSYSTETDVNCTSSITVHDDGNSKMDDQVEGQKLSDGSMNGNDDDLAETSVIRSKRRHEEDKDDVVPKIPKLNEPDGKCLSPNCSTISGDKMSRSFYDSSFWLPLFKTGHSNLYDKTDEKESDASDKLRSASSESVSSDLFPNISHNGSNSLKLPPSHLLPPNLEVDGKQILASHKSSNELNQNFTLEGCIEKRFSYLERINVKSKIKASSWSEYKHKKAELLAGMSKSPVEHLWNDTVTPLMHPAEVESYKDVIERLQIIQSADNNSLIPHISSLPNIPKISFDVHLPDHRFKKSMPGVPDHRVCVTRCDGIPPGLTAIQYLWGKYKDDVPLHWAVVDSGEIAFYVFDNSRSVEMLAP